MKSLISILFLLITSDISAQSTYEDTLKKHWANYVEKHEVVLEEDKKYLSFFPIDQKYKVQAKFERKEGSPWFLMETSGTQKKMYRVYGVLTFTIQDTVQQLYVYQSQSLMQTDQYKNHLFIPFTDANTGIETYATGRYIDLWMSDIVNNILFLDFNKAYNPYCAYVSGVYNCPIPPKENNLTVAIKAGEKAYSKSH